MHLPNVSRRRAGIWGDKHELLWPDVDTDCFDAILIELNEHHRKWVNAFVTSFRTCVQAGGNCGMYPLGYSKRFEKVVTFEPEPENFYCLVENTKEANVHRFQAALGEKPGIGFIEKKWPSNVGMHRMCQAGPDVRRGIEVQVMTIDSLNLENVDYLHLDIEGFEYYALLGSASTIQRWRPVVNLEISFMRKEIEELMASYGYEHHTDRNADHIFLPKPLAA